MGRVTPMRMSSLFIRTLREDPAEAEAESHRLLLRAGYVRRVAPGIYTWLPLGLKVLARIENIIREEMTAIGAQEVYFPELLPRDPYEKSRRWEEYGDNLFRLKDRKGADYLLAPTHEEMFTLLAKETCTSYKNLPVTLYQIQTKYRDEARPRAGLLRSRGFLMKDSYSFGLDQDDLDKAYQEHRAAYQRIFKRLGLDVVIVSAVAGAMGGSRSEEFLHPTDIGEDTFVHSPGGYAANVEAVTTSEIPATDYKGLPPAQVRQTPESATIGALVEVARGLFPDAGYTSAHMLKNVVLKVTYCRADVFRGPESSIVVVGVPGDREVDMRRVAANIGSLLGAGAEVDVSIAADEDLAENHLVRGYIGPGLSKDTQFLGKNHKSGIVYLVDAHVAVGSVWVTGANKDKEHVFGLVAGRDFDWDGVIEAAEIRDGDPAPDGSGALTAARGVELGHIFQLGTKYAEIFDFKVFDERGRAQTVFMGSYGIGVTRVMAAVVQKYADEAGIVWPHGIAPADVHLIAAGKSEAIYKYCANLVAELSEAGVETLYDDRKGSSVGVKFSDAELLGIPIIVVVGRGLAEGTLEIKDRASGKSRNIAIADAVGAIQEIAGK